MPQASKMPNQSEGKSRGLRLIRGHLASPRIWFGRYLLRTLIQASPHAIITLRLDGRVGTWNPAAERMFGWSGDEVRGKPLLIVPPETAEEHRYLLRDVLQGNLRHNVVITGQTRSGNRIQISVSAALVRDHRDVPLGVVALVSNVTRREQKQGVSALLHEVDLRILQDETLSSVLSFACQSLESLFNLCLARLGLATSDSLAGIGPCPGAPGESAAFAVEDAPDNCPCRRAILTGQVQKGYIDPSSHPFHPPACLKTCETCWFLSIPMVAGRETLGAITLFSPVPDLLEEESVATLVNFATGMAFSLVSAQKHRMNHIQAVALESAANAVILANREGIIQWVNPAFVNLTGYSFSEAIGQNLRSLQTGGSEGDLLYQQIWQTITAGNIWRGNLVSKRKDGTPYHEEQTITPVRIISGEPTHFIAVKQDISELKRQEERIRYLATHDMVTELPNRYALQEYLKDAVARAQRGIPGSLALLDLDNFRIVNDTVGHLAGDQLLIQLAQLLKDRLRPGDYLARSSGDEFAILMENTPAEVAAIIAERLRDAVDEHRFHIEGHSFGLAVSIGIAPVDGALDPKGVMVQADFALFRAKEEGRNRVVVYEAQPGQARLRTAGRWVTRIKDALKADQFILQYQPIVRLDDERIEHYEALIRWRADDGSLAPPGRFLPIAERFGLMPQIDRWVIQEVVKLMRQKPAKSFCINISGQSLKDVSLLEFIETHLHENGVSHDRIVFEITESTAVLNLRPVQLWMQRLRRLGCRFALDDFGVGFSSFSHLRSLPADYVKIDGTFIIDVDVDPTNLALVQAIKAVAQSLGKEVIAEWVETPSIAESLRAIGVEHGQGYLWGKPTELVGVSSQHPAELLE